MTGPSGAITSRFGGMIRSHTGDDLAQARATPVNFAPAPGFDWSCVTWVLADNAPAPDCSYCGAPTGEGEMPMELRTRTGWRASFCEHCQLTWWGMERLA